MHVYGFQFDKISSAIMKLTLNIQIRKTWLQNRNNLNKKVYLYIILI